MMATLSALVAALLGAMLALSALNGDWWSFGAASVFVAALVAHLRRT